MEKEKLVNLVGQDWADFLAGFMCPTEPGGSCPYDKIAAKLKEEYSKPEEQRPFPVQKQVFRCFKETPLSKVRIVMLGQDPYHVPGYANGLAFATDKGEKFDELPVSLQHIYNAIEQDVYNGVDLKKPQRCGILGRPKDDGTINRWTEQGVLLLNTALTVGKVEDPKKGWIGQPGSHEAIWAEFTDYIISNLWKLRKQPLIFMAWGAKAQNYVRHQVLRSEIDQFGHTYSKGVNVFHSFVLTAEHPANAAREKRAWATTSFSHANLLIRLNNLGAEIEW